MKTFVMAILAAAVAAATPTLAVAAEEPKAVAIRLADAPPANLDDYFAVKTALGDAAVKEVNQEVFRLAAERIGLKLESGRAYSACIFPAWSERVGAGLNLAIAVPDQAAWTAARGQIDKALDERQKTFDRIMAGDTPDPAYAPMAATAKAAAEATSPRAREYATRVARDQFARLSVAVVERKRLWATVDPAARAYLLAIPGTCAEDRTNTEWLKADLRQHGWPRIAELGPQADRHAWLLVQHADHDPAFQREALTLLERLVETQETSPRNYGLLYDRVATAEGRPQRYGTQGKCTGPGTWAPGEVEDPANLDVRRASLGFPPMAEYVKGFATICAAG